MDDITDRIKSVEMEIQLQKEIETDKIRTEFFSNISHELRTPTNVIYSALQVIEMYYDKRDINNIVRYNNVIKQNCNRLIRITDNLIDVTKVDSGLFKPKFSIYNIVNLIEEIALSVAVYVQCNKMNIVFDTEIEEKYLKCDPDLIERIMLNLLSNAVKFGKPGGNIFVNIYNKDSEVVIIVKDDGIGIPKDKQEKIFKRFIQVDKSFKRKSEGSGIGLNLVKH